MRVSIVLCSLLAACAASEADPVDPTATVSDGSDAVPATNPFGEARRCPTFETGTVSMEVGGLTRTLEVELPADPEGAPVVFAWHWLGGNATETLDWMGIRGLADEGFVVVAPESTGSILEWDVSTVGADNVDLALFDAMLPCLWDQLRIDEDRLYATGMSAGGLMTTWLTMHRADVLAATAPISGGAFAWDYTTPADAVPVLVTWGGPTDTYAGYDFHGASLAFAEALADDGHPVVTCEHAAGHVPPLETADMLSAFFADHVKGEPSPWQDGLPRSLPGWCATFE